MIATNTPTASPLLTATDVADRLGIARKTVYDMIREKRVPGVVQIGRLVRIRSADLETWIEAGGDAGPAR